MANIMPPPNAPSDVRINHPSKPVMGDDEDCVEYLWRTGSHWIDNPPPAPPGFELVECGATPRHWPAYSVVDDDLYPGCCPACYSDSQAEKIRELECKAKHRRWKSWRILGWLSSKGYSIGIIAGCGTSYGRCELCGIGTQHMRPRWRGRRPYILGVSRDTWTCLRHGHRRQESHWSRGLCTVCLPCPECGSTKPEHFSCDERPGGAA